VADAVLKRNDTWRGRAFVVNDWYISAYAPIPSLKGDTIGMLYVGTLERPYRDILYKNLYMYFGITLLAVGLATFGLFSAGVVHEAGAWLMPDPDRGRTLAEGLEICATRYRHALESLFWIIQVGVRDDWDKPLARSLRRYLNSVKSRQSDTLTRIDAALNWLLPKSIVLYARKPPGGRRSPG
jgi:hypothetical protein